MKYAQLVIGPAGCGKSTYCKVIQEHCNAIKRPCRVINMDPGAEHFNYECHVDVCEMVKVEEVMEHFGFGPNGALLFAMEYLLKKRDWLEETFECGFMEDDFLLFDCPGQIELYTHNPTFMEFIKMLLSWDYQVVGVFCIDVSFISDVTKFLAGSLSALATMTLLEIPHINVLTKMDLLNEQEKDKVYEMLDKSPSELLQDLPHKYRKMNEAIINLLEEWSLVSFITLDINDEDSIQECLMYTDNAIQYGENLEPDTNKEFNNQHHNDD